MAQVVIKFEDKGSDGGIKVSFEFDPEVEMNPELTPAQRLWLEVNAFIQQLMEDFNE